MKNKHNSQSHQNHTMPIRRVLTIGLVICALSLVSLSSIFGQNGTFAISASDIARGGKITDNQVLNGFGCSGKNISPAVSWENAPAGTKSFAVTFYDPDAPTGSGWWHWVVFNIPANTTGLKTGAGSGQAKLPAGSIEGMTDFGKPGFGGACPPEGSKHRYQLKVYALKDNLPLDASASAAMVGFYIHNMKLGEAMLESYSSR